MQTVGTVTFLFTDIEGSTRLIGQLRNAYGDVLEQHRTILRDAAARHDGEEVDTQGDAFFFSFHRAQDAVLAAAEAQRALTGHVWPGGALVKVRMGIHTGEPGRSVTGYHGLGVVRAARISAAGHGGQVLISQVTRSLVEDEELPGIEFKTLGEHRLKDIERPEHLSQLVIDGLPSEFPPPRGLESQTVKEEFVAPRRHVRRRLAAAGVVAIAAAAVLAYALTRSGGTVTVTPSSLAAIDPAKNRVIEDIPVGQQPGPVAVGEGGVWVLNVNDHTVSRIDPATKTSDRPIPINGTPTGLAVGGGHVWVVELEGTLARIDPTANRVDRTIRFGRQRSGGIAIAFGHGAVWVATPGYELDRIDARTGTHSIVTHGQATVDQCALAVGAGYVWASYETTDRLAKIDPNTRKVVDSTTVSQGTLANIAVGAGAVWVTASPMNTLSQISPDFLEVEKVTETGNSPVGVAVGRGAVWVANQADGTVSRVDPASARVTKTIHVGGSPNGIAVGDGLVWVTVD